MADIVGFLREDATHGEKLVLNLLRQNLPKEYTVYVETPIRKKRDIRYPDFIVLTNYGVIVLEVKDWVMIERADPKGAIIRTRKGETRHEHNPVDVARELAISLSNELNSKRYQGYPGEAIPWSYAAVLVNLPVSVITQLRSPWGEDFVFSKADLENPDMLLNRLKNTFLVKRMRMLGKDELAQVRATIYPVVEIETPGQAPFVLDEQQEKIIAEPVRQEPQTSPRKKARQTQELQHQEQLFASLKVNQGEEMPLEGDRISQNVAIRLVRGFSGSGKTLVLMQRARFLAAQYPEWKIGILTYNKPLQQQLEQTFKGTTIQTRTFHNLCGRLTDTPPESEVKVVNWLNEHAAEFPIIQKLSSTFVRNEIDWIRDMGINRLDEYLTQERKGIGKVARLQASDRRTLFEVYQAYRTALQKGKCWDWSEMPLMALQTLEANPLEENEWFDALLVDEAQDWAPVWFKVISKMVHPEHGLVFLADDPSQSIYRYFSWKEKGISVVGRTRWLRVPYRNTFEIYRAAYCLIANHAEIQKSLSEEGEMVEPELSSQSMRHGPPPLVRKLRNAAEELAHIKELTGSLQQEGYPGKQIAILTRYKRDMETIGNVLKGTNVTPYMIHSYKGLETEVVIIPHLQNTFQPSVDETNERRLLYMAMSRARSRLYLTYSGRLPAVFDNLRKQNFADFVV